MSKCTKCLKWYRWLMALCLGVHKTSTIIYTIAIKLIFTRSEHVYWKERSYYIPGKLMIKLYTYILQLSSFIILSWFALIGSSLKYIYSIVIAEYSFNYYFYFINIIIIYIYTIATVNIIYSTDLYNNLYIVQMHYNGHTYIYMYIYIGIIYVYIYIIYIIIMYNKVFYI